ncbi:MerR family transcriptional regulator [Streptomyces mirabilis]|uniref:MerR family transcriptional regulator n=1 Tax=Streptomyces mirabilis TaxID=68239 RepID=UPI0036BE0B92
MTTRLNRVRDRFASRPGRPSQSASHRVPWWVRWFTNAGRPVVAVVVLIMCAPGEHHLAVLAGWDGRLAWGMAAVLAAYAGIAASVASNRPAKSPGKVSAVVGAFVSLGAAMAAQPVSHLFVTGWFSADPRPPAALVIVVSCVPPLVFGHLLHLAATPVARSTETPSEQTVTVAETRPVVALVRFPSWDAAVPDGAQLLPIVSSGSETGRDAPETHRFITTGEVATRYGISVSTVRTWKDRGKITPAFMDPTRGAMYDPETLPRLTSAG